MPAPSTVASAMALGFVGLVRLGFGKPGVEQGERVARFGEVAGLRASVIGGFFVVRHRCRLVARKKAVHPTLTVLIHILKRV